MPTPAKEPSTGSGLNLVRVAGIQIRIHYSWLIIFMLVVWSLSAGYLPRAYPGEPGRLYWLAGLIGTVLFFVSVLVHELSHSLVAKSKGIPVSAITLFVFGGVSQLSEEASDPRTELEIAIVGPGASFALALLFWVIRVALWGDQATLMSTIVRYLAWINVALGVFNLVPGFPLDGGRMLRAVLWWKTGSLARATRRAADIGKGVAVALMVLGALQFVSGGIIGGMWLVFIGIFLKAAAEGEYQQMIVHRSLEGIRVRDAMIDDVLTVSPDLRVSELIEHYFLRYGYKGFPVARGGEVVGIASLKHVRHLSQEERDTTTVGQIMVDLGPEDVVDPGTSLADAWDKMNRSDVGRLVVMQGGRMVGLITKAGLGRLVEVKRALER